METKKDFPEVLWQLLWLINCVSSNLSLPGLYYFVLLHLMLNFEDTERNLEHKGDFIFFSLKTFSTLFHVCLTYLLILVPCNIRKRTQNCRTISNQLQEQLLRTRLIFQLGLNQTRELYRMNRSAKQTHCLATRADCTS